MKDASRKDQALLAAFVAAFSAEEYDIYGQPYAPPAAYITKPAQLAPLYAKLPGHFLPLYERLVLSYRWPPAELPPLDLLANPPGPTLEGLLAQIRRDPGFSWVSPVRKGWPGEL